MDSADDKSLLMQQHQQQQLMLSGGGGGGPLRPPSDLGAFSPLPWSSLGAYTESHDHLVDPNSAFKFPSSQGEDDVSVQALYNSFGGSLHPNANPFQPSQEGSIPGQHYGGDVGGNGAPPLTASAGGGSGGATPAPQRQRVRARRGQATDPHSIAERLRRERIAERMKALQELVPNANKTDKASMLDEIIDYLRFLQLQVKVLSMSRLGGASAAVAPHLADMSSEGGAGRSNNGPPTSDSMTVNEHQVAKLLEEDMGSAMQYLQGKGLCLMPISLATAISTATSHSPNPLRPPQLPLPVNGNKNTATDPKGNVEGSTDTGATNNKVSSATAQANVDK